MGKIEATQRLACAPAKDPADGEALSALAQQAENQKNY
jgi:hypothetical protein